MPDNLELQSAAPATPVAATVAATRSITYSGDSAQAPVGGIVLFAGADDAKTAADLVGGAGAVSAGVQRVTLASDDPAVVALQILDNAIAGTEMQVDVLTMPTVTVTGALTDAELRATAVPVSGPLTDAQLRAVAVPVSGPLTDAQLRATAVPVSLASAPSTPVTNVGTFAVQAAGDVAHDGVDSGAPVKTGAVAIAHGTNPTAVAAADRTNLYANRAGVPFVIGGHPNVLTLEAAYTAAQTDTAIITVGAGAKIVVTQIMAVLDEATTVGTGLRVGFGTANTPTTTGVVLTHPGLVPGSGLSRGDGSGILGVGADNEDLRITSDVPTSGSLRVLVSYYTIES